VEPFVDPTGLPRGRERHRIAVQNSLACAQAAADQGLFDDAMSWLEAVRTVDGELRPDWEERRSRWRAARDEQARDRARPLAVR
jgi:hypothetical protein